MTVHIPVWIVWAFGLFVILGGGVVIGCLMFASQVGKSVGRSLGW
jgi:hypothetical protein